MQGLQKAKQEGRKLSWLTAYDANHARLAEQSDVDVLLVGDSLGMVVLGHDSTLQVTLDDMIRHTSAVMRGSQRCMVVCDLPFGSYQASPAQAFENASRVLGETQCNAVKLEGGAHMAATVSFLAERGIPVVGHIGLTPQSIKILGSYKQRGKSESEATSLQKDALLLEESGAMSVVLEHMPSPLAKSITEALSIPTIGIGSGPDCDAQVMVWHDLLGISQTAPPFVKAYANLSNTTRKAISQWNNDVKNHRFPE